MAECRVSYDNSGKAIVLDNQGNPSKLYQKILDITGDQEASVNAWAAAMVSESGLSGEATSTEDLLSFMDSVASTESQLNEEELLSIRYTMARNGFSNMSELHKVLSGLFKPNGYIELPSIDTTGLYTQQDLRELDLKKVQTLLNKIEGHLFINEEEYIEPYDQDSYFIDASRKNILGMSERLTQSEVMSAIIEQIQDFSNVSEIEYAIKNSPYETFAEDFENNPQFREEVLGNLTDLRRIPTLSLVAGQLTDQNTSTYTAIKNTILSNISTTELEAELEYLSSISDYAWMSSPESIKGVIKELEKTMADFNIDVVGISEHSGSRAIVLDILGEAIIMLKNPTHSNISKFAEKLQLLVPKSPNSIVEISNEDYDGYNIVNMETFAEESELFNKHGLIKIGEDLYHKVDQNADINVAVDFLAKRYVEGEYSIPEAFKSTTDLTNKTGVLEDINSYLASKNEIEGLDNKMLYTAYKEVFGHPERSAPIEEASTLTSITTDEDYLKSDFITDFYNYMLQEKVKNSQVYHNVLRHFQITDKDISIKGRPSSIKGLKFEKELSDYIKIKRGSRMRYLIQEESYPLVMEDMVVLNFPETVLEHDGEYMRHGRNSVVLPLTPNNYVKIDGELYRKVVSNTHSNIFSRIVTQKDPVYLTSSMDFTVNREDMAKELNMHQSLETPSELSEEVLKEQPMFGQSRNIEDYSTILDSSVNLVALYNENEKQSIVDKLDECGG